MIKHHTPPGIRPPFAYYSHGVEVPPGVRWLLCSGQLGIDPDDSVPEDAGAQAERAFENIRAILAASNMDMSDVVKLNTYVTDRAFLGDYMQVRDRFVGNPPPASTLMIVSGFARPEFKVEIEAIAAKAD